METKNLLNKKITQWLLLVAMLVGCSASIFAAGFNGQTTAIFSLNGSDKIYNITSASWSIGGNCDPSTSGSLNGQTFDVTSGLTFKGGGVGGWTSTGDWLCGEVQYKFYLSSEPSSWSYYKFNNYDSGTGGVTGCWSGSKCYVDGTGANVDLVGNNDPGSYKFKVQLNSRYRWASGSQSQSELKGPVTATVTINAYVTGDGVSKTWGQWKKMTKESDGLYSVSVVSGKGLKFSNIANYNDGLYGNYSAGTSTGVTLSKDKDNNWVATVSTGYKDPVFYLNTSTHKVYATATVACTDPKVNSQTTDAAFYCKNASSVTQLSVNASGTNATYKWQQSTTGTSDWSDVSTGTGYTTANFTPSVASSGTLYYKCIVSACNTTAESAVSGAIKVYGDPTATTGTTVSVTNTTATVSGSSCATGTPASTITEYGIEINSTKYNKTSGDESSFAVALTGLSANTTYTYKAYVTDGCTTKYGDEKSFTTAPSSIYVRGPIMGDNGDGGSGDCWNNAGYYEMQNNGSNVFTKTFNPSGNYCDYGPKEFVLTMENNDNHKLNPDWFDSKTGCQKSSRQGEGDNFESTLKYSNADELTLTVTWNGDEDYTISLAKTNNKPSNLYIKGPLVDGNWDGGYKQPGYTASGNTYVFTFNARTGGGDDAFEFCISSTQGDKGKIHYTTTKGTYAGWDFEDTQEGKNFVASDQIVTRDNFPIKVTVTYVGGADYDFTLDIESNGCEKPTLSLTMPYSSGKTYNRITANAQITNKGTCTINEFGVEAFSNADCTQRVSGTTGSTSSTDEQHLVVTGLTANTKYWFRAYAKTDDGDTYSSVVTDFTRVNAEKMSATNITSSSATLQGKALTDGGFATELKSNAVFKYGTTNVVADATSVTSSSKAIGSVITYDLSGLAAGTTYYYWFCPTTTDGEHASTPNYLMNTFTTNRVHDPIVLADQSVCVGANITLTPTCATATNGFTYSSDNTSVATVDANTGEVHGVAAGSATITVTTKEVSGYDVKTKDITVTVNAAAFTIVVSPDSPLAYQVVTLSASNGKSTTWTKASSDAYFVGADGLVISGNEATAESIKLKAKSGATSTVYTISATQSDGTCAYNTREITVSADTENCSGN